MSEFTTAVSDVREGTVIIRGYPQAEIMRHLSYAEGAFLTITGRLPTSPETRLTDAVLTSLLDHGFVASTVTAARYIASGNPQFVPAVAGGILAAGANTLSPEHAYGLIVHTLLVQDQQNLGVDEASAVVVSEYVSAKKRIPGLGHPIHRDGDFRADVLFDLATELGLAGAATTVYRAIHHAFVEQTGRTSIPINVDGALAAIGKDIGWSANQTVAFALLAVLPGLMAHVIEEIDGARPLRHITDGVYTGASERSVPSEFKRNGDA